jgi:MarR family transcriptional regulator, organic hydroperoxide resistance regulator
VCELLGSPLILGRIGHMATVPRTDNADEVDLDDMVCFALHAASRAVTSAYRPLLEPLGLTYPQYLVLSTLWKYGEQPVGQLVQLLQLDYGTMTPLVKRLEKQGLVRRIRSPEDERSVIVSLTDQGAALRDHANGIYEAISDRFDFSPKRARTINRQLQSIIDRATQ